MIMIYDSLLLNNTTQATLPAWTKADNYASFLRRENKVKGFFTKKIFGK